MGFATVDLKSHTRDDGTRLLVLTGEIDVACAERIREAGEQCMDSPDCAAVIVDLLDVTFIDSTGIGALVAIRNRAEASGTKLVLHRPSDSVARILQIVGLDSVFTIDG